MAQLDAVIFDLDGTLIDSAADIAAAVNRVMEDIDEAPLDVKTVRGFIGNGARTLMERVIAYRQLENAELNVLFADFKRYYEAAPSAQTVILDGVIPTLTTLRKHGLKCAICTNKPEGATHLILRDLELDGFFDVVIGGDTLGVLKPDPAPLFAVAKQLNIDPSRLAFVGDSEVDMQTAEAAGVRFVFVDGGYCHIPQESVRADVYLANMGELPAALVQLS